ncbi:sialidase family protein [Paeniglutamicibacter psychrophenolicus]|uniref:sialidase family protein n=1 Tax=Paeniglutamicibacter psychrophenolicus TaxID=257454 RepID=UPI0027843216|nr:sialidase family protein [Paeniglutamicibacter psychrophenolicus]MDQ0093682.1 sialidase-1 [Paeniglutamicibacter psychrophenolicus]
MTHDVSPFSHQVLAARGAGGHRQYRIPALAVSTRGTVLAAYDGRPNLDDLPNTIDLLLRRSFDNGASWEAQQEIRTGSGLQGFGDPSLLVDKITGRIFCFHAAGTHAGFFEAVEGLEPDDAVQHVDVSFSDDDGESWSHRRLTGALKREGITGIFAAAGAGIQLQDGPWAGRLVQQMVILLHGNIRAASAYSDDHGQSWTLGQATATEANENKVVELPGGRVLLNSRARGARLQAISTDGGHSYGPLEEVPSLPDPSDNGSILRLPAPGAGPGLLLATNNRDTDLRRNTVLSMSRDEGAGWRPVAAIRRGSSAYSTAALLPDGSLGVLYEDNGYSEIVFARLAAEHLAPAALEAAAAAYLDDDGGDFCLVLRSITPGRPAAWRSVGESHTISAAPAQWGVHTWKEIGQGYGDGDQVLGTREAQDVNYGPAAPGLRAGDILAFTGRFRNPSGHTVEAVLDGNFDGDVAASFPAAAVTPGEAALYFTPKYTVTEADVARGHSMVHCALHAGGKTWERSFRADTATGAVTELHSG